MDAQYTAKFLSDIDRAVSSHHVPDDNRRVLRGVYDALIRGEFDRFGEMLTDDAELEIIGAGPMDGRWKGRAAVIAAARANFAQVGQQKPEIESVISHGDCAALLFREQGIVQGDGRSYRVRATQWFRFAGGKVRRIDEIVAAEIGEPPFTA